MSESVSLDIVNYWTTNDFLTEVNKNCGTLVAFDWKGDSLIQINTNIDSSTKNLMGIYKESKKNTDN